MPREPKVFTAIAEDADEASLEPIPFRLEGLRMRPHVGANADLPPDVAVEISTWLELDADRKRAILEQYKDQLTTNWSEDFTSLPQAPTGALDDLMRSVRVDEAGQTQYNAPSVMRFFEQVLIDESHVARFNALCRDKDRMLPIDKLGDVLIWLAKEITDRPTGPSPA